MALTDRQQAFVAEYLKDLNATQAAIRAGYSEKSATEQASRLLTNVKVAAAIIAAKSQRSERTKVDADWVLSRLADEAQADLADLYDETGALKPVKDWPLIWRQGLVAGVDLEEIKIEGITIGTVRKVKLSDRIRRIELIGKHVDIQAFKEKHEHTGKDGGPIAIEDVSDRDRAKAMAALISKMRDATE